MRILFILFIFSGIGNLTNAQDTATVTYPSLGNSCYTATLLTTKNPIHVLSTAGGYTPATASQDIFELYRKPQQASQATFLKFTCTVEGNLNFTIIPDDPSTELDWVLFRFTSCEPRVKHIESILAGNYYDNQSPFTLDINTGMSAGGAPEDFEPFLVEKKLEANQPYILMISNRSKNGKGFRIQWGGNYSLAYQYAFPEAFSPNGDGVNDVFGGIGYGIDVFSYELKIYDRFGKLIYRSYDPDEKWNGNFGNDTKYPLDPGVFVYTVTYLNNAGEYFSRKGVVALSK